MSSRRRQLAAKRAFDLAFAIPVGVVALPVIGVLLPTIHALSPEAPALFRQTRIGYGVQPFTMYKLRTMTDERDASGQLLPDEQRLKTWGKLIRKLSLDELPQLFNIVAGQMSWIGPRPLLPHEMLVMTETEQAERQSMLPGITGWEAVNEDKSDNRREMAEFDLWYVRNWSLGLDAKIFFLTAAKLFRADRSDDEHRAPKMDEGTVQLRMQHE